MEPFDQYTYYFDYCNANDETVWKPTEGATTHSAFLRQFLNNLSNSSQNRAWWNI